MLTRVARKWHQAITWLRGSYGPADWPAALALAAFRTRLPVGDGLGDRLARRLFPGIWIRPRFLGGAAVRVNPADMGHFVIFEEVFFTRVYDVDRLRFQPDVVVDCGAFEGYFSLLAASRFRSARVIAFEPDRRNFEGLTANVQRNGAAVELRQEAVATADGIAQFSGDGCGGMLVDAAAAGRPVTVTNLARFLEGVKSERLLLKLDVEGEELRLLPVIVPMLPAQCAMFLEWHHGDASFREVEQQLTAQGFVVSRTRTASIDGVVYIDALAQRG